MSRHLNILRKARIDADLFPHRAAPAHGGNRRPAPVAELVTPHGQWQQLVHELFLRREPEGPRAIGFASATAGEGTSYVVQHVAGELARLTEQPALLLEANLYRPSQAVRHGLEADPGLRRILANREFPVERCLRRTAFHHLWMLPAGSTSDGSPAAPEWARFPPVMQCLRERFSGIVVDMPPVNLSTDAMILSPLFDGVVLVVQADLCSREVIQNAVHRLGRANRNVLGTILNKRKFVIPEPIYRRL